MKYLIAPDAFKGSLTASEAAGAIEAGLKRACPQARSMVLPLADGGEGSAATLQTALKGRRIEVTVQGPLGDAVDAHYALVQAGRVAVIEVAQACGLIQIPPNLRNPLATTTFGVGQLIRHALDRRIEEIWVCLGGSATVDGGLGMACALGAKGFDTFENAVSPNGKGLIDLRQLDLDEMDPRLQQVKVLALCDVDNVLAGPDGASMFMTQKGADAATVEVLDNALTRWGALLHQVQGIEVTHLPGAGAAGGLGAGLAGLLNAKLTPGIDFILDRLRIDQHLLDSDVVLTGEGRLDEQTIRGKVVAGLAKRAQAYGVPVLAFCGTAEGKLDALYALGIRHIYPLAQAVGDIDDAMKNAASYLEETAFFVGRQLMTKGIPART